MRIIKEIITIVSLSLFCWILGGGGKVAKAQSAADVLLESVGESEKAGAEKDIQAATDMTSITSLDGMKLSDQFLLALFTAWKIHPGLSYEINGWVSNILRHKFEAAAHLWSAIEQRLPADFRKNAELARLYLMWKLDLPQTFFDLWIEQIKDPSIRKTSLFLGLEQVIAPSALKWFMDNAIVIGENERKVIEKLDGRQGPFISVAKTWASLRLGVKAIALLKSLDHLHPFKLLLGKTAVLALARQGKLGQAGRLLKHEIGPAVYAQNNSQELVSYYLSLARLLYQAQALDAAEDFYRRIPDGVPEFLQARVELTWILLRQGKVGTLRGELATLSSDVFDEQFLPEVFLVRAISNLKLCQYDQVQKDFSEFIRVNKKWAKKISSALKQEKMLPVKTKDHFIKLSELSIKKRLQEKKKLQQLGKRSIRATLPAVGIQSHWLAAQKRMDGFLANARKRLAQEYRRFWKNRDFILSETIRKMRFVKVETMSQIYMANRKGNDLTKAKGSGDQVSTIRSARKRDEMKFPFDGVIWPDELFRLHSVARDYCLGLGQKKK